MISKTFSLVVLPLFIIGFIFSGCKDSSLPTGGGGGGSGLTATPTSVTIEIADDAICSVKGGVRPYSIKTYPRDSIASVYLDDSTLYIHGSGVGNDKVEIQDSGGVSSVRINITIKTSAVTGNVIMPLKVGNRWVYKLSDYDTMGVQTYSGFDTLTIVRDTMISGEKWYFDSWNYVLINKSSGFWVWDIYDSLSSPYLYAKYPANVNDTYSLYGSTVTIVSTNASISVPAGNYSCYKYRWNDNSDNTLRAYQYWAVNKGWIQGEYYYMTESGSVYKGFQRELVSYTHTTPMKVNLKPNGNKANHFWNIFQRK